MSKKTKILIGLFSLVALIALGTGVWAFTSGKFKSSALETDARILGTVTAQGECRLGQTVVTAESVANDFFTWDVTVTVNNGIGYFKILTLISGAEFKLKAANSCPPPKWIAGFLQI